jgi:beta-xylosidase
MMMINSFRGFSSTASVEKSIQKLNKALEKEIKYENENYSQLDDIETYLNESGFKFSEEENGITMTLTKSLGDKVVEVQFEARYVSYLSIFPNFSLILCGGYLLL